jgi:ABC-type enterochelin transport system ATPase subunit
MIETEGLARKFGGVVAVDGLTLQVNDGEVFEFLGPNGAGKTTTVRMLCCLISKTSGTEQIAGYDVGNESDAMKMRKLIGLVPDNVACTIFIRAALLRFESDLPQRGDTDKMEIGASASKHPHLPTGRDPYEVETTLRKA